MRSIITTAVLIAALCSGCNDPNAMETTLQALERGKAQGQLIFTTDGRVSVSQSVGFGIGAGESTLSFSGKIDFSEPAKE